MRSFPLFLLLVCSLTPASLSAQGKVQPAKPQPTELRTTPWIIGSETADHWKGLPLTVNAPDLRTQAFPGQHLTVALGAQGEGRDTLLAGSTCTFTVSFAGTTKAFKAIHPSQVRRIKAEGADMVRRVLEAGEVQSPTKDLDNMLSLVSLGLFDLDWQVPADAHDGTATFTGSVTMADGKTVPLKPATLEIQSADRVAKDGAFKDPKAGGEWMMTYYQHPNPFRLLHELRAMKGDRTATQPNILAFYVQILKSSPLAAGDLMKRLAQEDRSLRIYALLVLSEAGCDLSGCLAALPREDQDTFKQIRTSASPLPDPYDFSVNLDDPYQITTRMDMLWSLFLATGDQKPVRAIADTLAWREDGKAVLEIRKSKKKIDAITPGLLHGLAYGAGGWSLGSFFRNHPLVADYVDAWRQDPKTPRVIREELGTLITNDAFKMQ